MLILWRTDSNQLAYLCVFPFEIPLDISGLNILKNGRPIYKKNIQILKIHSIEEAAESEIELWICLLLESHCSERTEK